MTIQTYKLDTGEELTLNTNSLEFQAAENLARNSLALRRADEAFFFARNLEFIRQHVFNPVYAELKLLNGGIIPINTSIPDWADTDTYAVLDAVGEAKVIADFADDIPTVEVFGTEYSGKIKSIAEGYLYSVADMRRDNNNMANMGGPVRSVINSKVIAARRAIDQKLERMLGFGDATVGITGLFNNPNVNINVVANSGTGSSTLWANKTAALILEDIEKAINDMVDASNGGLEPTHLLTDHKSYSLMRTKPLDTSNYSGKNILKYVQEDLGLIVVSIQQLKGAFVGGSSGFVLYNQGEENAEGVIPMRLMVHPPQKVELSTKTIIEAKCGGTRVFFPKALSYNYGI